MYLLLVDDTDMFYYYFVWVFALVRLVVALAPATSAATVILPCTAATATSSFTALVGVVQLPAPAISPFRTPAGLVTPLTAAMTQHARAVLLYVTMLVASEAEVSLFFLALPDGMPLLSAAMAHEERALLLAVAYLSA